MKTVLMAVGPQGSGNHLFAKVFALHPAVGGWKALLDQHWQAHHLEPFASFWEDPSRLSPAAFRGHEYWVTSCSIPYVYQGAHRMPPVLEFYQACSRLQLRVIPCLIVRDQNITLLQQRRVRGKVTLTKAMHHILGLMDRLDFTFLSYECLYMYRGAYLRFLSDRLCFPFDWGSPSLDRILELDANLKYVNQVRRQALDDVVAATYRDSKRLRG